MWQMYLVRKIYRVNFCHQLSHDLTTVFIFSQLNQQGKYNESLVLGIPRLTALCMFLYTTCVRRHFLIQLECRRVHRSKWEDTQ